jgi:hypothetical protein
LRELIAYLEGKKEAGGVFNYSEMKGSQKNNSVPVKEGNPSKVNTYVFYENEPFLLRSFSLWTTSLDGRYSSLSGAGGLYSR